MKAGLGRLCKLFGKTRQAYYERQWHQDTRNLETELILELVREERKDGRFGVRILMDMLEPKLAEYHIKIGRDRMYNLLREHGMLIRPRRRYTLTTDSNHHYRKWPNLIENIEITAPEQVWVSDITYIRTQQGFLYLSLITDNYSKKLMGYHLSHRLEARGPLAALKMALSQREYPDRLLVHHSDRGVQYCCNSYIEALQKVGIEVSMAEKGNPYQNPAAERINRTVKEQLGMDQTFLNYQQAFKKLVRVVEVYNHRRPHSSCDRMTPHEAHLAEGQLKKKWKNYRRKPPEPEALAALRTSRQV